MATQFIVPRVGQTPPVVKSMTSAAFAAAGGVTPVLPEGVSYIKPVAGYKFSARIESAGTVPDTIELVRHNQSAMAVETGVTWTALTDSLAVNTANKGGITADVNLIGSFFKVKNSISAQIGLNAPSLATPPLGDPTFFFSLLSGMDNYGNSFTPSLGVDEPIGYEIEEDAIVLREGNTVLHSYPRTWSGVIASNSIGVVWGNDTATLSNQPYSQAAQIKTGDVPAVTAVIITLTDDLADHSEMKSFQFAPPLTANDLNITGAVGESYSLDLTTLTTGGGGGLSFTVAKGSLPQGLAINGNSLEGTFQKDISARVRLSVTDVAGQASEIDVVYDIKPQANVTIFPPKASKGTFFSYTPKLPAGFEGLVLNTDLPAGLSINPTTGKIFGTPTAEGEYTVSVNATVNGLTEPVQFDLIVYAPIVVSYSTGDNIYTVLSPNVPVNVKREALTDLAIQGGSGQYLVTANNGAVVNLFNQVQFLNSGETIVTVIDAITGSQVSFTFEVSGQDAVFAFGVRQSATNVTQRNRPLVCEVGKPITVGFGRWTVLDYDSNRMLRLNPINIQNFDAIGEGTAFAMFTSKTDDSKLQMPRARNFVSSIAIDDAMFTAGTDISFGLGRLSDDDLKYEVAITTVAGVRMAEIRVGGNVVVSSRVEVASGQVLKVASINDRFGMYLDGALKSSITGEGLDYWDFIVTVRQPNLSLGGQITGLTYSILTDGAPAAVGTIHPQTGLYSPSDNNVSVVSVQGAIANTDVSYQTDIVVIRGSVLESFRLATVQNKPLNIWIADQERGDNKRLRFTEDGRPDANQIKNAVYVGTLQSSGKWDATEKRNDFSNDKGVYDTGYTLTKYTLTGNVLQVMNPRIVKALVPFIEIHSDELGSLAFSQKSTGCIPPRRVIAVWQSSFCGETGGVWDAVEFPNAKSFTPFNWEVGTEVATNLAMSIEAYPEEGTDYLWHLYRYDSQFVEV